MTDELQALENAIRAYAASRAGQPDACLDTARPIHLACITTAFSFANSHALTIEGTPPRFMFISTGHDRQWYWIDPITGKHNQAKAGIIDTLDRYIHLRTQSAT